MSHSFGCVRHLGGIYIDNQEKLLEKAGFKGRKKAICCCIRGIAPLYFLSLFSWHHLLLGSPLLKENQALQYLSYSLMLASIFLYLISLCLDPGTLQIHPSLDEFVKMNRIDLEKQYSPYTNELMIMRASYCPFCQKQVRLLQFHSILLNNCVGANNAPCYYLFTLVLFVLSGLLLVLVGIQWHYFIFQIFFLALLILVLTLLPSLMFSGETFLLLSASICKNLTYFEKENQHHHFYLQKNDRSLYNPFNRGCFVNMVQFFLPSMPCLIGGKVHTQRKQVAMREKNEEQKQSKEAGQYAKVDMSETEESSELDELFPHHALMHQFKRNQIYNWGKANILSIFDIQKHPLIQIILPMQIKRVKKKRAKRIRKQQERQAQQALQNQRALQAKRALSASLEEEEQ